jgi:hypothetical protein
VKEENNTRGCGVVKLGIPEKSSVIEEILEGECRESGGKSGFF